MQPNQLASRVCYNVGDLIGGLLGGGGGGSDTTTTSTTSSQTVSTGVEVANLVSPTTTINEAPINISTPVSVTTPPVNVSVPINITTPTPDNSGVNAILASLTASTATQANIPAQPATPVNDQAVLDAIDQGNHIQLLIGVAGLVGYAFFNYIEKRKKVHA